MYYRRTADEEQLPTLPQPDKDISHKRIQQEWLTFHISKIFYPFARNQFGQPHPSSPSRARESGAERRTHAPSHSYNAGCFNTGFTRFTAAATELNNATFNLEANCM